MEEHPGASPAAGLHPIVAGSPLPDRSSISKATARTSSPFRKLATGGVLVTALILIVVGLMDSFRLWSGGEVDPRIPH